MKRCVLALVLLIATAAQANYLGIKQIDDYLRITARVLNPSTGALAQPTAITYSIYEEGSATGLDEGVDMVPASPFDGVTGIYLASRQLTAVAGFEAGKSYQVWVGWTVNSTAMGEWHNFQVGATVTAGTVSDKTGYALSSTQTFNVTGNITGNLSGSVGSVTGAVGSVTAGVSLADDAITSAKYDESSAFPLASADTGATAVARVGADSDTLETLSDQLDAVALASELAQTDANVASILEDTGTTLDGIVDAILEDTGTTLPALFPTDFATVAVADAKIAASTSVSIDANDVNDIADQVVTALSGEVTVAEAGLTHWFTSIISTDPNSGSPMYYLRHPPLWK